MKRGTVGAPGWKRREAFSPESVRPLTDQIANSLGNSVGNESRFPSGSRTRCEGRGQCRIRAGELEVRAQLNERRADLRSAP